MAEFMIVPVIIMGTLIGLIELFFVHADEKGLGWLSHGLHALPVAFFLTFIAMNLEFAASLMNFSLQSNFWLDLGIRTVLGLVAAFKVKAAAAVVKGHNSVGESLPHALIVGALIAASPYIWMGIGPLIEPVLPAFLQ